MNWAAIASAAAQIGSAYAASKAQGRAAEATINQAQDRTAQQAYATDKSLDLNALVNAYQAQLERAKGQLDEYEKKLTAPQARAANSVRGDILANIEDAGVSAPPGVNVTSFSGGLRPSLLSGNSRLLGQQTSKEALLDALSDTPTPYSSLKPFDVSSITGRSAPAQTPLPQASTIDKIIEGGSTAAALAAAIGQAMGQPQRDAAQARTVANQLATNPYLGLAPGIGTRAPNAPWVPPATA